MVNILPSTANRPSVDVILLSLPPAPLNPGHHSIQKDIEFTLKDPSYHYQRGGKTGHCLKNCMCLSKSIMLFAMSPTATVNHDAESLTNESNSIMKGP